MIKKIVFLAFVLSFSQVFFAAAGNIALPEKKQEVKTEASVSDAQALVVKPVSFIEEVESGQFQDASEVKKKYADKILQDDISWFGSLGRGFVKAGLFAGLFVLSELNFNIAYAGTALTDEALIAAGLFKDSKVFRFHKDVTWWQWCKATDSMLSGLPAEGVGTERQIACMFGGLPALTILPGEDVESDRLFISLLNVVSLGIYSVLASLNFKDLTQVKKEKNVKFSCVVSYILADCIRNKMTDPEGSPRIANIVSIVLAGGMNELIKKLDSCTSS